MLYGENFTILKKFGNWYKIKLHTDNYVGFIIKKKFAKPFKPTHKVSVLAANIYRKPSSKAKKNKKLTFSSKIFAKEKYGSFIKFENQWIRTKNLKPINYKNKNIFSKVDLFKGNLEKWSTHTQLIFFFKLFIVFISSYSENLIAHLVSFEFNVFIRKGKD